MFELKKKFAEKMLKDTSDEMGADLKSKYGPKPPPEPSPEAPTPELGSDMPEAREGAEGGEAKWTPDQGLEALPTEVIDALRAIVDAASKPKDEAPTEGALEGS